MAVDSQREKERDEVHCAIWTIADELRGAVDGWDFKNYVLGTMFYRYISENLSAYIDSGEGSAGNTGFSYADLSDQDAEEARGGLVSEKGFFGQEINITTYNLCVSICSCTISVFLRPVFLRRRVKWLWRLSCILCLGLHRMEWRLSYVSRESCTVAEQKIRKYLVDNNYVNCVIQLPSNLFFGTSIATCIMVMKKKLTSENIDHRVDAFTGREVIEYLCHLAFYDEVKEQDYNLSVSSYVEAEDTREKIDIVKLNAEIKEIVAREQVFRDEIDKIIAEIEGGDA